MQGINATFITMSIPSHSSLLQHRHRSIPLIALRRDLINIRHILVFLQQHVFRAVGEVSAIVHRALAEDRVFVGGDGGGAREGAVPEGGEAREVFFGGWGEGPDLQYELVSVREDIGGCCGGCAHLHHGFAVPTRQDDGFLVFEHYSPDRFRRTA